jgi:ABC-type transporter Mla subunit MlaD
VKLTHFGTSNTANHGDNPAKKQALFSRSVPDDLQGARLPGFQCGFQNFDTLGVAALLGFFDVILDKYQGMLSTIANSGLPLTDIFQKDVDEVAARRKDIAAILQQLEKDYEATAIKAGQAIDSIDHSNLITNIVDVFSQAGAALEKMGDKSADVAQAQGDIRDNTREQKADQEDINRILEARRNILADILDQNAGIQLQIDSIGADEREIAYKVLQANIAVIDRRLALLREEKIIVEQINALGQREVTQGKEIVDAYEDQKRLLAELTALRFETPGEAFSRFAKMGIDATKYLIKAAKEAKAALGSMSEADFSKLGASVSASLKSAASSLWATLKDPKALADIAGSLIDVAVEFGSTISDVLFTAFDTVSSAIGGAKDFILQFDKEALDLLKNLPKMLTDALSRMPEILRQMAMTFKDGIKAVMDALPAVIREIVKAMPEIIDAFTEGLNILIEALPGIIDQLLDALPGIVARILDKLPEMITKISEAIPQIAASLFETIPDLFIAIVERLPAIVQSLISGLIGSIAEVAIAFVDEFVTKGGAYRMAEALVKAIIQLVPAIVIGILQGLSRAIGSIFNGFKMPDLDIKPFEKAVDRIVDKVSRAAGQVAEELFGFVDLPSAGQRVGQGVEDIPQLIGDLMFKAGNEIRGLWDQFLDLLKAAWMWIWDNILEPIYELIVSAWRWVWDNVIEPIWNIVVGAFNWVLENVLQPIWNIIVDAFKWVWDNVIKPIWNLITSVFQWVWDKIFQPINSMFVGTFNWIKTNIFDPINSMIVGTFYWIRDTIFAPINSLFVGTFYWIRDTIFKPINSMIVGTFYWIKDIFDSINSVFVGTFNWLKDNIFGPFIDAINSIGNIGGGGGGILSGLGLASGGMVPNRVQNFATGGNVSSGTDTVPAMLTPGEFVFRKSAVDSFGAGNLSYMNSTGQMPSGGGGNTNVVNIDQGAITIIQSPGEDQAALADRVIQEIQFRSAVNGQYIVAEAGVRRI